MNKIKFFMVEAQNYESIEAEINELGLDIIDAKTDMMLTSIGQEMLLVTVIYRE